MILWPETFRRGWLAYGETVRPFYLPPSKLDDRPLAAGHAVALHTLFRLLKPNEFWL